MNKVELNTKIHCIDCSTEKLRFVSFIAMQHWMKEKVFVWKVKKVESENTRQEVEGVGNEAFVYCIG